MKKKDWRDNVTFILVEPKESGNIGAAARAIKNMGFRSLRLVKPPEVISDEAGWFAHNATDVLERAESHPDLASSIADCGLVAGTSRRTGKKRGVFLSVDEGSRRLRAFAENNRVAVLFGRESRGLFNEEVEECGFLMKIPSAPSQPSLNLGQAVLIVAYEMMRCGYGRESSSEERLPGVLVAHRDLDSLYRRVREALKILGYIPRGDHDLEQKIMQNLGHFIGRAGLAEWELNMLHGIISQVELVCAGKSGRKDK